MPPFDVDSYKQQLITQLEFLKKNQTSIESRFEDRLRSLTNELEKASDEKSLLKVKRSIDHLEMKIFRTLGKIVKKVNETDQSSKSYIQQKKKKSILRSLKKNMNPLKSFRKPVKPEEMSLLNDELIQIQLREEFNDNQQIFLDILNTTDPTSNLDDLFDTLDRESLKTAFLTLDLRKVASKIKLIQIFNYAEIALQTPSNNEDKQAFNKINEQAKLFYMIDELGLGIAPKSYIDDSTITEKMTYLTMIKLEQREVTKEEIEANLTIIDTMFQGGANDFVKEKARFLIQKMENSDYAKTDEGDKAVKAYSEKHNRIDFIDLINKLEDEVKISLDSGYLDKSAGWSHRVAFLHKLFSTKDTSADKEGDLYHLLDARKKLKEQLDLSRTLTEEFNNEFESSKGLSMALQETHKKDLMASVSGKKLELANHKILFLKEEIRVRLKAKLQCIDMLFEISHFNDKLSKHLFDRTIKTNFSEFEKIIYPNTVALNKISEMSSQLDYHDKFFEAKMHKKILDSSEFNVDSHFMNDNFKTATLGKAIIRISEYPILFTPSFLLTLDMDKKNSQAKKIIAALQEPNPKKREEFTNLISKIYLYTAPIGYKNGSMSDEEMKKVQLYLLKTGALLALLPSEELRKLNKTFKIIRNTFKNTDEGSEELGKDPIAEGMDEIEYPGLESIKPLITSTLSKKEIESELYRIFLKVDQPIPKRINEASQLLKGNLDPQTSNIFIATLNKIWGSVKQLIKSSGLTFFQTPETLTDTINDKLNEALNDNHTNSNPKH